MSFRDALNTYCDKNGIDAMHNSAMRIIRSAAGNTVYQMRRATAADRRAMREYERNIPNMFQALMSLHIGTPLIRHIDELSDLSLAELILIARTANPSNHILISHLTHQR